MGKRKMSAWEKAARIEMINREMSVADLAEAIGRSTSHVIPVLTCRLIAPPTHNAISEYLEIPSDLDTTIPA